MANNVFIVLNSIGSGNIYIIGHQNPSVRTIVLVSHTTYVVCANFIHKWPDLRFKVDSERQTFLRKFSWQFLFYSQSFCQKSAERKSPKKYFLYFILMSGLGLEPWRLQEVAILNIINKTITDLLNKYVFIALTSMFLPL